MTTNADTGSCPSATHCSLRGALTAAAAASNPQRIEFALSACPQTILVSSALPAIVDELTIDGYSQPGASANSVEFGSDARLCVILKRNYASSHGLLANNVASRFTAKGLAFENSANINTSEMTECFVEDTIFAHDFDTPSSCACAP